MPYISVVMPAYNAEKTIKSAIDSVLRQSFGDLELIVINDCSTDGTGDIIRSYSENDSRVVVITNEKNSGVSFSRNVGVEMARGEWIAFLDSDDMWADTKLEKQISALERHSDSSVSYTASSFIDSDGEPYDYIMEAEEKTVYSTLLRKNLMSCSSVMIRSSVMKKLKMPNDKMHEDYYIWLTVLKDGGYACGVNEPLLIYRLSSNSKSSNRLRSAKMLYNTYRAVGYGAVISSLYVCRYFVHSVSKRHRIKSR